MGGVPRLGKAVRTAVRDLGNLFIAPILIFCLLKDGTRIRDGLMEMCFGGKHGGGVACERRRTAEACSRTRID